VVTTCSRWEQEKEIRSSLAEGTNILIDRYAYSGAAFSAAKPGLSLAWCKQPDVGLPRPDLVVFLDVSEEVARQRGGFGEERYEVAEFQRRVRSNYRELEDPSWVQVSRLLDSPLQNMLLKLFLAIMVVCPFLLCWCRCPRTGAWRRWRGSWRPWWWRRWPGTGAWWASCGPRERRSESTRTILSSVQLGCEPTLRFNCNYSTISIHLFDFL